MARVKKSSSVFDDANSLGQIIEHEKLRYRYKGVSGAFIGVTLLLAYFTLVPSYMKTVWPQIEAALTVPQLRYYSMPVVHTVVVLSLCILVNILYALRSPAIEKYKVNDEAWPWDKDMQAWRKLFWKTVWIVGINHLVLTPLMLLFMVYGYLGSTPEYRIDAATFPEPAEIAAQVLFIQFWDDFGTYVFHRLWHHKSVYFIHKLHHEYNVSTGIAAEYEHPIQYVVSSIPAIIGPMILNEKLHVFTFWMWLGWKLTDTTEMHSGYEFPWSFTRVVPFSNFVAQHDYHHSHNIGAFAPYFVFWDTITGCNDQYFRHLEKEMAKKLPAGKEKVQ